MSRRVGIRTVSIGMASLPFFRKNAVANAVAGAGTGYQIQITVHKGAGVDSGADVYLGANVLDNFGDVRFTASDGSTLLDYFIEEKVDGSYAVFWVEVSADLSSQQTIYIYYGKSDTATTSNGENTFPWLFDDLNNYSIGDSPNTTDWLTTGIAAGNTINVQQDPADATKKCFRLVESGDNVQTSLFALLKSYRLGYAFHFRFRHASGYDLYFLGLEDAVARTTVRRQPGGPPIYVQWYNDITAWHDFNPVFTLTVNTWYTIIEKLMDTGQTFLHWVKDGVDLIGGLRSAPTLGVNKYEFRTDKTVAAINFIGGVGTNNRYIFARKFVSPEPSIASWGTEEKTSRNVW